MKTLLCLAKLNFALLCVLAFPLPTGAELLSISTTSSVDFTLPIHLSDTTPDPLHPLDLTSYVIVTGPMVTPDASTDISIALTPGLLPDNAVIKLATVHWEMNNDSSAVVLVFPAFNPNPLPLLPPLPADITFNGNLGGLFHGYSFNDIDHQFTTSSVSDFFGGSRVVYQQFVIPIGGGSPLSALLAGDPISFDWSPNMSVTYGVVFPGLSSVTIYDGVATGTARADLRLDVEYTVPAVDQNQVPEPPSLLLTLCCGSMILLQRRLRAQRGG